MQADQNDQQPNSGNNGQEQQPAKAGAPMQQQTANEQQKAKAKMQAVLRQLIIQLKQGCKKQFCFNKLCKKNLFEPVGKHFANDTEMVKFAIETLKAAKQELDELICSDTPTYNRAEIKGASNEILTRLIEDCPAFCCSFQDQTADEDDNDGDGEGGMQAQSSTDQQESVAMQSEVSAFQIDEEMKEEEQKNQQAIQAEMLAKEREAVVAKRKELAQKYKPLAIDRVAVREFFQKLKDLLNDEQQFWESIEIMADIIMHEFEASDSDPMTQLMCVRGLMLLMLNEHFADYMGQSIAEKVLTQMVDILGPSIYEDQQQVMDMGLQSNLEPPPIPAVEYMSIMPTKMLHEFVMQLQNILTLNIIQGAQINYQLFTESIKVLDLIQWVNVNYKDTVDQIEKKEFHNDAVNNNLDLRLFQAQWADRTFQQINKDLPLTRSQQFNPCEYHWLMTPHNKTCMLQRYNKIEWQVNADYFLMRAFMDQSIRQRLGDCQRFLLEISRDNILEDSLQKIVNVKPIEDHDPLKLPISARFAGEPGIDEGGVRKEYFQLVIKELLSPNYAMFQYNEDVQLYYFNGMTLEPNIYFELIGILMGIAVYNNTFIDLPFPMACFKVLVGEEPNLDDLRQWQPETARSLEEILNWDEAKMGGTMEEVLCRTFTADVESFGEIIQKELKPGGFEITVTKATAHEFVRLYIDFQFKTQCEGQLASFRKGFERLLDMRLVKSLFDYEEVETLICGQRELNFEELRDNCIYANGFTPTCEQMVWLWDIVLEEWEDDKKRKWLAFSTGSDRAPVNGLKSLKFYIIQDGEDDQRLPSSHTCFNQLLIPKYSSKDILRERLQTAVENSTGFGMV